MNKPSHFEFQEHDMEKTWNLLAEKFGFDKKKWKVRFEEYCSKRQRYEDDKLGAFFKFGNTFINPLLNDILCRNPLYPTFNNLTEFVLTGKKQN
ncbi:MAG: hypothetical protein QM734_05370 [Cyclobacteriaceae bacterium]